MEASAVDTVCWKLLSIVQMTTKQFEAVIHSSCDELYGDVLTISRQLEAISQSSSSSDRNLNITRHAAYTKLEALRHASSEQLEALRHASSQQLEDTRHRAALQLENLRHAAVSSVVEAVTSPSRPPADVAAVSCSTKAASSSSTMPKAVKTTARRGKAVATPVSLEVVRAVGQRAATRSATAAAATTTANIKAVRSPACPDAASLKAFTITSRNGVVITSESLQPVRPAGPEDVTSRNSSKALTPPVSPAAVTTPDRWEAVASPASPIPDSSEAVRDGELSGRERTPSGRTTLKTRGPRTTSKPKASESWISGRGPTSKDRLKDPALEEMLMGFTARSPLGSGASPDLCERIISPLETRKLCGGTSKSKPTRKDAKTKRTPPVAKTTPSKAAKRLLATVLSKKPEPDRQSTVEPALTQKSQRFSRILEDFSFSDDDEQTNAEKSTTTSSDDGQQLAETSNREESLEAKSSEEKSRGKIADFPRQPSGSGRLAGLLEAEQLGPCHNRSQSSQEAADRVEDQPAVSNSEEEHQAGLKSGEEPRVVLNSGQEQQTDTDSGQGQLGVSNRGHEQQADTNSVQVQPAVTNRGQWLQGRISNRALEQEDDLNIVQDQLNIVQDQNLPHDRNGRETDANRRSRNADQLKSEELGKNAQKASGCVLGNSRRKLPWGNGDRLMPTEGSGGGAKTSSGRTETQHEDGCSEEGDSLTDVLVQTDLTAEECDAAVKQRLEQQSKLGVTSFIAVEQQQLTAAETEPPTAGSFNSVLSPSCPDEVENERGDDFDDKDDKDNENYVPPSDDDESYVPSPDDDESYTPSSDDQSHVPPSQDDKDEAESRKKRLRSHSGSSRHDDVVVVKKRPKTRQYAGAEEADYACEYCDKVFRSRGTLYMHRRFHLNLLPFGCSACDQAFLSKSNLETHIRRHHSDGGPGTFRCALCATTFQLTQNLNLHLRQRHPGAVVSVAKSRCRECGESFDSQSLLKSHREAVHTERQLACEVCGKLFLWPAHLRDHARAHTKEKPFRCEVCGGRYSTRTHAYDHVRAVHPAHDVTASVTIVSSDEAATVPPKHARPGRRKQKAGQPNICAKARALQQEGISGEMQAQQRRQQVEQPEVVGQKKSPGKMAPAEVACPACHVAFRNETRMRAHMRRCTGKSGTKKQQSRGRAK